MLTDQQYIDAALSSGISQADIDHFLAANPDDEHRLYEALALPADSGDTSSGDHTQASDTNYAKPNTNNPYDTPGSDVRYAPPTVTGQQSTPAAAPGQLLPGSPGPAAYVPPALPTTPAGPAPPGTTSRTQAARNDGDPNPITNTGASSGTTDVHGPGTVQTLGSPAPTSTGTGVPTAPPASVSLSLASLSSLGTPMLIALAAVALFFLMKE